MLESLASTLERLSGCVSIVQTLEEDSITGIQVCMNGITRQSGHCQGRRLLFGGGEITFLDRGDELFGPAVKSKPAQPQYNGCSTLHCLIRSRVPAWGGVRGMRWTVLLVPLVARPGLDRTVQEFLQEIAAVRALCQNVVEICFVYF